jgi:hypothetical protein
VFACLILGNASHSLGRALGRLKPFRSVMRNTSCLRHSENTPVIVSTQVKAETALSLALSLPCHMLLLRCYSLPASILDEAIKYYAADSAAAACKLIFILLVGFIMYISSATLLAFVMYHQPVTFIPWCRSAHFQHACMALHGSLHQQQSPDGLHYGMQGHG